MTTEGPDEADVGLLQRRLARERRARLTAEQVGEQATATLYETVQQLREAQDELQDQAEQQRLLHQISRELRSDLDGEALLHRAVVSVGEATGAERCLIRLVDEDHIGPILEQWTRPGVSRLDPRTTLPTSLQRLSLVAAGARRRSACPTSTATSG